MKKLVVGALCSVGVMLLTGCTIQEQMPASRVHRLEKQQQAYDTNDNRVRYVSNDDTGYACYVRDDDGRQWRAEAGRESCRHALRKCRRWHDQRDMDDERCWIDN